MLHDTSNNCMCWYNSCTTHTHIRRSTIMSYGRILNICIRCWRRRVDVQSHLRIKWFLQHAESCAVSFILVCTLQFFILQKKCVYILSSLQQLVCVDYLFSIQITNKPLLKQTSKTIVCIDLFILENINMTLMVIITCRPLIFINRGVWCTVYK